MAEGLAEDTDPRVVRRLDVDRQTERVRHIPSAPHLWVCDAREMRWTGVGTDLWRVRVDLFAEDDDASRGGLIAQRLEKLLSHSDGAESAGVDVDQGTGAAGHPVVGLLFWVRGDDVGGAAMTALAIARAAASGVGAGPDLYDLTLIPEAAVVFPDDGKYPYMYY